MLTEISIRKIYTPRKALNFPESLRILDVYGIIAGKEMVQDLHKRDFFSMLFLKKHTGNDMADFARYTDCDSSDFFMRSGIHQMTRKAGSTEHHQIEFKPVSNSSSG